jgi:hypothetical protein
LSVFLDFTAINFPPHEWRFRAVQLWVCRSLGFACASVNERLEKNSRKLLEKENHRSDCIVYNDGARALRRDTGVGLGKDWARHLAKTRIARFF